jgi:hypothetical protein
MPEERPWLRVLLFLAAFPVAVLVVLIVERLIGHHDGTAGAKQLILKLEIITISLVLAGYLRRELLETIHFIITGKLHDETTQGLWHLAQLLLAIGGSFAIYLLLARLAENAA